MRVVTSDQMREYDRFAIEQIGIPGIVLMENAGAAVAAVIAKEHNTLKRTPIAIFCGGGNNGGDGFVAARRLALLGARPTVYFFGKAENLKPDAAAHFQLLSHIGIPVIQVKEPQNLSIAPQTALAVDALLGTGSKGAPREPIRSAIAQLNSLDCPIYSIDIPSGIDSDTGAVPAEAVKATHTITLACPKIGLFLFPAADYVGKLHVSDIGFCWDTLDLPYVGQVFAPHHISSEVASLLMPRHPNANKGDFGHVAVLAGSRGMVGAPALVARAAQRAGAGLVTVLAPSCIQPLLAMKLDEQMTLPLADEEGAIAEAALPAILEFAQKATLFCIGPGLTTHPKTVALLHLLLRELSKPIVLDADGLNALALRPDCLQDRPVEAPLVLTPHPGEAARLLGTTPREIESDRVGAVRKLATQLRAIVLLKGRYTLIAAPDGALFVNTTGNPGMATGGSGDVLTGILGGILAQVLARQRHKTDITNRVHSLAEVVAFGAYLHGLAGDLARQRVGEPALTAGEIIHCLPEAFANMSGAFNECFTEPAA